MEQATTIGLDIAKHVFQLHGVLPGMCCSASASLA